MARWVARKALRCVVLGGALSSPAPTSRRELCVWDKKVHGFKYSERGVPHYQWKRSSASAGLVPWLVERLGLG